MIGLTTDILEVILISQLKIETVKQKHLLNRQKIDTFLTRMQEITIDEIKRQLEQIKNMRDKDNIINKQ